MWNYLMNIGLLLFVALTFSACASNTEQPSQAGTVELGANCDADTECKRGVCDQDVCALAGTDCEADEQCLSWEFCDEGTCVDKCALMGVCSGDAICRRGECIPSEENACEDLMDCSPYEVCNQGTCVSNGTCEPAYQGWFMNADGVCEEGIKSGCSNPFPHNTEEECQQALDGTVTSCPESSDPFFDTVDDVAGKGLRCEYGEECCCGECHPSLVCHAEAGGEVSCYATDACLIPGCPCETKEDCKSGETCADGFCQPAQTCMAYWEGAELEDGICVAKSGSGCSNPFTYDSVGHCCHENPGACELTYEEETCVNAGGDWKLFTNTCVDRCGAGDVCGDAMTMGCDCGPDACWNGKACVGNREITACKADTDCAQGKVCETNREGSKVCVSGCHDDDDCMGDMVCNTDIQCVTIPCPGQCQAP